MLLQTTTPRAVETCTRRHGFNSFVPFASFAIFAFLMPSRPPCEFAVKPKVEYNTG